LVFNWQSVKGQVYFYGVWNHQHSGSLICTLCNLAGNLGVYSIWNNIPSGTFTLLNSTISVSSKRTFVHSAPTGQTHSQTQLQSQSYLRSYLVNNGVINHVAQGVLSADSTSFIVNSGQYNANTGNGLKLTFNGVITQNGTSTLTVSGNGSFVLGNYQGSGGSLLLLLNSTLIVPNPFNISAGYATCGSTIISPLMRYQSTDGVFRILASLTFVGNLSFETAGAIFLNMNSSTKCDYLGNTKADVTHQ
jgi:hypothetical protein